MPNTELLTAREVAERLGVHPETVRRWTRQGDVTPAVRYPSGRCKYREDDLAAMTAKPAA